MNADTSNEEVNPSPARALAVYIAARGQDQALAALCRQELAAHDVSSTARWIDASLVEESHAEAQMDLDDVRAADALIVIKPQSSHQVTTGGHHVETGVALERGMPIVLLGARENVFHRHHAVVVVPWPVESWEGLAGLVGTLVSAHRGARGDV